MNESESNQLIKEISLKFNFFNKNRFESEIDNKYYKFHLKNSVTFFGGTFDPLHLGHIECLKLCPENNIVVMLDRNPQKVFREINKIFELENLANQLMSYPVSIYPGFWLLDHPNPTSSWIQNVMIEEVNLLMGDDSFVGILNWINPELIIKRVTKIYVVPRVHSLIEIETIISKIVLINSKIEVIVLENHQYQNLSSSKLK